MEIGEDDKLAWILKSGWKGLCPKCGEGKMFQSWLKVSTHCDKCGLDYRFASPDDGPAFFSLTFVAFPILFFVVWLQVSLELSPIALFAISIPLMGVGCALPLRPIKGWLVASQYMNKSVEAGTEKLWRDMHQREDRANKDEDQD